MTEVLPRAKKQKTASYSTPAESAAADKAAEAVSEEDTGFTEELPPLPFVHQYRSGNFFCARVLREILPICEENASGQQREVRDRDGDTRHRQIGLLRLFFQRFRREPESTRFESINGFYLPKMKPTGSSTVVTAEDVIAWNTDAKNRVILFQMTISMTHPVKASGILSVLEKLGLLEVINSDPKRAALVFVVPKSTTSSFKRQEIVPEATDNSPVKSIKGIGPVAERNLPAKAILSRAQRNLESMRDKTYSEAMAQIPQYAWFTQG
ncbi:hypothetical protein JG687_00011717 [Phytophthora cactorum]|uniref:Uncharacterized protein n=1 Tax=Phytophthora cactorum TaxID=29920 RepID=A0A8T1U515_9STRA|nr:hypothetical protein JG687_00011717 [Phytophthora cactorum]